MRFHLIDRIDAHEPGRFLRGCKFLALGEEYLADHFPRFPVMPGVLMLQCLVEAGAWLWRTTSGYRHPVVVLREVKNVKYGSFMTPGRRMDVAVDLVKAEGDLATFKGKGTNDAGQQTVAAQLCGIRVGRVNATTFVITGLLGGIAGAMICASVGTLSPLLTAPLTTKGLIVTVIGGLGSIPGAIIAGLLVGGFESVLQQYRGVTERDLYVMLLLFVFLVFRPGGIFPAKSGRD